jgi:hypothetical protein
MAQTTAIRSGEEQRYRSGKRMTKKRSSGGSHYRVETESPDKLRKEGQRKRYLIIVVKLLMCFVKIPYFIGFRSEVVWSLSSSNARYIIINKIVVKESSFHTIMWAVAVADEVVKFLNFFNPPFFSFFF